MAKRKRREATPIRHTRSSSYRPWVRAISGAAALTAAAFLVYAPALHGGTLWDDLAHITPPGLRSLDGLRAIWLSPGSTQQFYPLLHTAFWLEWQLWQDQTFAYHVANVLQHVVSAALLWGVLRRLQIRWAFLAALLFAVHPVNVESVAWITEQKNTLSTIFYLGAAWCYLRFADGSGTGDAAARKPGWYVAALGLFVLGLLTKTVVATLPAALLVIAWWRSGRVDIRKDVVPLAPWFAIGAVAGVFTAWTERVLIGAQGAEFELSGVQRLLLAGRVIWFYLSKLLWPSELIFFYPRWTIDPGDWIWWFYLFGVVAAVGLLAVSWIRGGLRAPLAAFLFFAGTLFPVLGFLNVYPFRFSYVADHFQYLAAIGIITLAAGSLGSLAHARPGARAYLHAGAAAIVVTLGWLSWKQGDQYGHDAIHHYRAILERNPDSWISYENWGAQLIDMGRHEEAVPLLRKALELNPDFFEGQRDLGRALERLGRHDEALSYFERASHLAPEPKTGAYLYGSALLRARKAHEALPHLQNAVALANREGRPIAAFHVDLGRAYVAVGKLEEAVAEFRLAQKVAGARFPAADMLLGDTLVRLGRRAEAAPYLKLAVEYDPGDAIHRLDLATVLFDERRYEEASRYLDEAIRLRPDLVDAYVVLALSRSKLGQEAAAREAALEGLRVARPLVDAAELRRIEETLAPILRSAPPPRASGPWPWSATP